MTTTRSSPPRVGEFAERGEHVVVVIDVQAAHHDGALRVRGDDLVLQRLEPVEPTRAECEVVTCGRELPGHLGAQPELGR